jgi:rhodanese-related sulfurtransferase
MSVESVIPDELHAWLAAPPPQSPRVVVIDARDDDRDGGHIPGSRHFPEAAATDAKVIDLAAELIDAHNAAPAIVVVHCMESMIRGPRTAQRLAAAIVQLGADAALPQVYVLKGGFRRWLHHYQGTPWVEGFNPAYW